MPALGRKASEPLCTPSKLGAMLSNDSLDVSDANWFALLQCAHAHEKCSISYPPVRRDESVVETLHGRGVADPYRWLEDEDSPSTKAFVDAQARTFASYMEQMVGSAKRDDVCAKLRKMYNYEKWGCPSRHGERYCFFSHNSGLQNQSVMYKQQCAALQTKHSPGRTLGSAQVLLDPNALSADGTAAVGTRAFSRDGSKLAYAVSRSGSDWATIRVRDVRTCTDLGPDVIQWVKFSHISWTPDGAGFFYSRYDAPKGLATTDDGGAAGTETTASKFHKLYYHALGTPQHVDVLVWDDPEHEDYMFAAEVTDDGAYVLLTIFESCDPVNKLYAAPLDALLAAAADARTTFVRLVDDFRAQFEYVANDGAKLLLKTNLDAPSYKLVGVDISGALGGGGGALTFSDALPESEHVLEWAQCVAGDRLICCYVEHVKNVLKQYTLPSGVAAPCVFERDVPLPSLGTVSGFSGERAHEEVYYSFTSFLYPGSAYMYEPRTGKLTLIFETVVPGFKASRYVTEQAFYTSKDGTRVPMFLVHGRGLKKDGNNATLLYGYGGFAISLTPYFSAFRLVLLQLLGGVYALANIRGGGEYGETWHQAGTKAHKQRVFDDFHGAAEHLIRAGYTRPAKLAIQGGSNGGLLVAACANQRPELYGAVLCQVGVLDMLRFHKFTIGHAWMSEYGSPDDAADFEHIIKYSPLHTVRADKRYPAMLLLTADHDDRVVPLHTFKHIATLQHLVARQPQQEGVAILARIERKAGHGAGKPTEKVIEEAADMYCFLLVNLDVAF